MKDIPKTIRVNTGEQHELSNTIDDFFMETKEFFQRERGLEERHFQIKSGELAYNSMQLTDDRVTYLTYKDIIIASVFQTRTEHNHVQYVFFRNLDSLDN